MPRDRPEDAAHGAHVRRSGRWWHTWTSDGDSKRQLIEIEFEERDGATTVRFTHRGLWDEESVESHRGGWGTAFDNLERVLAGAARGGAA